MLSKQYQECTTSLHIDQSESSALNDHWTGLLEWTTFLRKKSFSCPIMRFPCTTAFCFKSISHSIIYLTAQNHTYLK